MCSEPRADVRVCMPNINWKPELSWTLVIIKLANSNPAVRWKDGPMTVTVPFFESVVALPMMDGVFLLIAGIVAC